VAKVCDELKIVDDSLLEMSRRAIYPEPELKGRLFHLAILGLVLRGVRASGYQLISRRPIGASSNGPAYTFNQGSGRLAHVWFEAAPAWTFYKRPSPYVEAAEGVPGAGSPIGADVMVIIPNERALIIECKYSRNPQTVARGGYEQTVAYAAEAAARLVPFVEGIVVGPEGVVLESRRTTLTVGGITIAPPSTLQSDVRAFLEQGAAQ
jgi:hypothetical protein